MSFGSMAEIVNSQNERRLFIVNTAEKEDAEIRNLTESLKLEWAIRKLSNF